MKQHMIKIVTLGSLLISSSIGVHAKTLGSHVHGLSELTIAIGNETVEIEMTSPAMNLVGFEHKAHDKADIDLVNKITKQLNNHKELFSFSGSSCLLIDSSTDTSSLMSPDNAQESHNELNEHDEHESHHDDHDDEHDEHESHHDDHDDEHDKHESHHDDHDDEHSKHSSHYEITSYYRYHCKKASTLSAITVRMFDQFSGVNQITAKWLTERQQGSVTLSPTKQIIKLR